MVTTTEVFDVVRRSPGNLGFGVKRWIEDELEKLGAGADEVVTATLPALASDDRNERVRALRVLALYPDERATAGVLSALRDPVRRVREVAIKAARPHHVVSAEVVTELRRIAEDERETGRIRRHAFFVLSSSTTQDAVPDIAGEALTGLMDSTRFRQPILLRLCKAPNQTDASRVVLREFVRTGTKDEAVMATRALCGQMLVRVDGWVPAEARQRIREQYDAAPPPFQGCWMPRDEAVELARSVGYPSVP